MFQGQKLSKPEKRATEGVKLGPLLPLVQGGISIFNWSKYGDSFSSDSKVSQANVPKYWKIEIGVIGFYG